MVCRGRGIPSLHRQETQAGPSSPQDKWGGMGRGENSICCGLGNLDMAGGAANPCGQRYPKCRGRVFEVRAGRGEPHGVEEAL